MSKYFKNRTHILHFKLVH